MLHHPLLPLCRHPATLLIVAANARLGDDLLSTERERPHVDIQGSDIQ